MKRVYYIHIMLILGIMVVFLLSVCKRGSTSDKPPIHLNPNMDNQPKYKSQSESAYFVNGASNRQPVVGTVARGDLKEDTEFYFGKDNNGKFIKASPVPFTDQLVKRGKSRYNIYCAPCHNNNGNGKGKVIEKGFIPPPTFVHERVVAYPDGQIFDIITNGYRNMPSYRHQIPAQDRWAIISYIHQLQKELNNKQENNKKN